MKYTVLYLVLLICLKGFTQNDSIPDYTEIQSERFERAEMNLKQGKLRQAAELYRSVLVYPERNISAIATQRLDSIIPMIREESVKQWIGTWKLKSLHEDKYRYLIPDVIVITKEKIDFYNRNSIGVNEMIRSEKINYAPPLPFIHEFDFCDLLFENKQIFRLEAVKRKREERLLLKIISPEEGTYIRIIYEGWKLSRREQRKLEEEEYNTTFYIRQ